MAAAAILNFSKYAFPTSSICSKSKSQCFHYFLWRWVKYKRNASIFSKSKMAAATILKSTLAVEPLSQEMNSLFVIFNKKCSFYWGVLTFKSSLLSGDLMLKRFLQEIHTFTGQNVSLFWTRDPLIVNLKASNSQEARTSIGTRLLSH